MKYHIKENTVQETRVIPLYGCKRCSGLYPNLFRDETETGLDFHNQILILDMIKRLAREERISAIINTHYPTNAMSVADEARLLIFRTRRTSPTRSMCRRSWMS
mgnify:FL=1